MGKGVSKEVRARAARVRLLILDVDGVLTDGRIIMDHEGREIKAFHVRDGHGHTDGTEFSGGPKEGR
jgi:3-deoxy-D-manno-octulosonate 8-phosphate phosphatase (KDO 8-P phosphatase)